jgi:uncharacterized delta-60 repeat protein
LAGRGDLDASYGTNGRLTAATIFYDPFIVPVSHLRALNLPDDRLMTVEGSLMRRFDSEGRLDLSFGDNGETAFPQPDATLSFSLTFNPVATPDGGLLLAGFIRDDLGTTFFEALIRLDGDGQLLTSFGGNGDGVYRLTAEPIPELCGGICTALMGVAVDSAGRVLLAKRSWNAQGHCSGAPRVDRLTPEGAIDSAFGTDGGTEVTGVDLCTGALAFGARGDDSIVVAGGRGVISLDPSGAREATFGASGFLSLASSVMWSSAELLPDGGLLLAGSSGPPSQGGAVLAQFDRLGRPDLLFGAGTGKLQLDLGASLFGISGAKQVVSRMALDPNTGDLYLQVSLLRGNGEALCAGGIVRLAIDGTPDAGFGERGITCLDFGAFPFTLIGVQGNGAPLFGQLDGNIYRLLVDGSASRGFLTLARSGVTHEVGEKDGSAAVSVVRTAGRDGVVSAHFYTKPAPPDPRSRPPSTAHIAGADSDYRTASGRLEWADGEAGSRSTNVEIFDDSDQEAREIFLVEFDDLQGGTELYGTGKFIVGINDDDSVAIDDDDGATQTDDAPSGGGGSTPWYAVAALAALAARARARPRDTRRQS